MFNLNLRSSFYVSDHVSHPYETTGKIIILYIFGFLSQWPRGLRRGFAAARLLGLWVRIPPGARMPVSCECCVLSGRDLCDGPITRPDESYRVCLCVFLSVIVKPRRGGRVLESGRSATGKTKIIFY